MSDKTRDQQIEDAVRIALAIASGRVAVSEDHVAYGLSEIFDRLSDDNKFNTVAFLVGQQVPDSTVREMEAALDVIREGYDFDNWIIDQLTEIGSRYPGPECETTRDLLARAIAAGDRQAQKLIDMGISEMRMSPKVTLEEGA